MYDEFFKNRSNRAILNGTFFIRVLLRAGGGEADQEEGGVKTSLIVSTLRSPRPEGKRRIGLHTEELSKTQRADGIRHQDEFFIKHK